MAAFAFFLNLRSSNVRTWGDNLQVEWIHASLVLAQVVDMQTGGYFNRVEPLKKETVSIK